MPSWWPSNPEEWLRTVFVYAPLCAFIAAICAVMAFAWGALAWELATRLL
jgi:hypothetical protein